MSLWVWNYCSTFLFDGKVCHSFGVSNNAGGLRQVLWTALVGFHFQFDLGVCKLNSLSLHQPSLCYPFIVGVRWSTITSTPFLSAASHGTLTIETCAMSSRSLEKLIKLRFVLELADCAYTRERLFAKETQEDLGALDLWHLPVEELVIAQSTSLIKGYTTFLLAAWSFRDCFDPLAWYSTFA